MDEFIPDKYDYIVEIVNELKSTLPLILKMKKNIWLVSVIR